MKRVGKATRAALKVARDQAWAEYLVLGVQVASDEADARAGRAVSIWAAQRMGSLRLVARMYERADRAARKCGL